MATDNCPTCGKQIYVNGERAYADHICPAKFYEWTIKVRVNATWVADGFDLTAKRAHAMVGRDLQHAHSHEFEAEIISAPDADEVAREMGYKSAADRQVRK